jgi:hypothetical protein
MSTAWLAFCTSVIFAPARSYMKRSRSGLAVRSALAMMP